MTPSKVCKQHGITLAELISATGESNQNLHAMLKSKPRRFELLCKGVAAEKFSSTKERISDIGRAFDTMRHALMKMGLHREEEASNARLSHEVRMAACEFKNGSINKARKSIRELYKTST